VEDHVGPVALDHVESERNAPEVGERRHGFDEAMVVAQGGRQLDERRLGVVDEDEPGGTEARQPRGELRADRSRSAGDQNRRAGDVLRELVVSDLDRRATQQCFDRAVVRAPIRFTRDSDYVTPFRGISQAWSIARARATTTRS
jgi:hypothetical protein